MTNPTENLRTVHSDLIKLAAELVRGEGVPDWSDHKFYRTTPIGERREIMCALRDADEALRNYAVRLKAIADRLSDSIPARQSAEQRAYEAHEEAALAGGYGK